MSKHMAKTDHERFCRCGHNQDQHVDGAGRCTASEPDRCSCLGYRPGKRSYGTDRSLAMIVHDMRTRTRQAKQRREAAGAELLSFGPVWIDPREMARRQKMMVT